MLCFNESDGDQHSTTSRYLGNKNENTLLSFLLAFCDCHLLHNVQDIIFRLNTPGPDGDQQWDE